MTKMTIVKAVDIKSNSLNPCGVRAGADQGDPQVATIELAANAGGALGVWECQPGGWPVMNRPNTEFAYIIYGKAKITDDATGEQIAVTAGDLVILPPGWTGRWDILEATRKVYAIF